MLASTSRMCRSLSTDARDYPSTLAALNTLITPVGKIRAKDLLYINSLDAVHHYVDSLELDLSSVRWIHVAGTKGKGSTCAMTELMLRRLGLKTGLYTSPHLIHPRERIRISGKPIDEDMFVRSFWSIWDRLETTRTAEFPSMPTYFRFLTLMAFETFVREKVDVAVIEVGMGGRLDATNVIPNPVVCACTSLGYDHMSVLGDTLTLIGREKAGIFKPSVPAILSLQDPEGLDALLRQAHAVEAPAILVPPLSTFEQIYGSKIALGMDGIHQRLNASVAISLVGTFLQRTKLIDDPIVSEFSSAFVPVLKDPPVPIPCEHDGFAPFGSWSPSYEFAVPSAVPAFIPDALSECRVAGRSHRIDLDVGSSVVSFHLDGAHTDESLASTRLWFTDSSKLLAADCRSSLSVLMFHCSNERKARDLLGSVFAGRLRRHAEWKQRIPVEDVHFDCIAFCIPESSHESLRGMDSNLSDAVESETSELNEQYFSEKTSVQLEEFADCLDLLGLSTPESLAKEAALRWRDAQRRGLRKDEQGVPSILVAPSVMSMLRLLVSSASDGSQVSCLVTGSLYLVGDVLSVLQPHEDPVLCKSALIDRFGSSNIHVR